MFRRSAALCFRHSVVLGVKHPAHGRPAELEIAAAIDAVAERNGKAPLELDTEQDVQELESGPGNSVLGVLEQRGLVKEIAGGRDALDRLLINKRISVYSGIDPTASSMHLGHLVPLMALFWLFAHGHRAITVVGGATATIGDPTDRLTARQAMEPSEHKENAVSIRDQAKKLWIRAEHRLRAHGLLQADEETPEGILGPRRRVCNNSEWMQDLSVIDFLQRMGTAARLGPMLGRDTVKNRLANSEGMSFAEFTYPLIQAWDWWHLYSKDSVQLQIGGSDQFGNIISGIDAIKHIYAHEETSLENVRDPKIARNAPYGLTVPLLTTSSGVKFGKSAGNALWLDPKLMNAFDLYGILLRTSDADVRRYLTMFTFVPMEVVESTMESHMNDPPKRKAQHLLAYEVLALVHGETQAFTTAEKHTRMRNGTIESVLPSVADTLLKAPRAKEQVDSIKPKEDSTSELDHTEYDAVLPASRVVGLPMVRVMYFAGFFPSRKESNNAMQQGGVYVGSYVEGSKHSSEKALQFRQLIKGTGASTVLLDNKFIYLRLGKWKTKIILMVSDPEYERRRLAGKITGGKDSITGKATVTGANHAREDKQGKSQAKKKSRSPPGG